MRRASPVAARIHCLAVAIGLAPVACSRAATRCAGTACAMETHDRTVAAASRVRMLVSRRELRAEFHMNARQRWGWPTQSARRGAHGFAWTVLVPGMDGPVGLTASVLAPDSMARVFPSLAALVRTAQVSQCMPGGRRMRNCETSAMSAFAEGDTVVLVLRDSARIARLFGMRPAFVLISEARPDGNPPLDSVRVEYVAPEIPLPDAVTRADSAHSARRYQASITSFHRYIDAGDRLESPIWLVVDDLVPLRVNEHQCMGDTWCPSGPAMATDSGWTVDDSSIARLLRPADDAPRTDWKSLGMRFYLKAVRPGRTTIHVRGVHAPSDTLPSRSTPVRELARDVIVTLPLARIRIAPRPDVVADGRAFYLGARVFDASGRAVAAYPVRYDVEGERGARGAPSESVISLDLRRRGRTRIIASVPAIADTLFVTVVDSSSVGPTRVRLP